MLRDVLSPGAVSSGAVLAAFLLTGCDESDVVTTPGDEMAGSTCVACHTDEARLRAVADPEPPPEHDPGEG